MASYLITGGCGFIGTHLSQHLLALGHRVRIIDNLCDQQTHTLGAAVDFIQGDCRSQLLLDEYLQGVEGVFHLAATPYPGAEQSDWLAAHQMNLGTTVALIEALRRHAGQRKIRLVYASSAEVYGGQHSHPLQEQILPCPESAYGTDKLCGELQIRAASRQFDLPCSMLRLFNVYGASHNLARPTEDVIACFVRNLLAGQPLSIEGDGEQTRDFVFIDDAVRMLNAAMQSASTAAPVINLCSGVSYSINQVVSQLLRVSGQLSELLRAPARLGQIRQSVGDPHKAHQLLGVQARTELQQGLRQTYQHYAAQAQPAVGQQWA